MSTEHSESKVSGVPWGPSERAATGVVGAATGVVGAANGLVGAGALGTERRKKY